MYHHPLRHSQPTPLRPKIRYHPVLPAPLSLPPSGTRKKKPRENKENVKMGKDGKDVDGGCEDVGITGMWGCEDGRGEVKKEGVYGRSCKFFHTSKFKWGTIWFKGLLGKDGFGLSWRLCL